MVAVETHRCTAAEAEGAEDVEGAACVQNTLPREKTAPNTGATL